MTEDTEPDRKTHRAVLNDLIDAVEAEGWTVTKIRNADIGPHSPDTAVTLDLEYLSWENND